MKQQRGFTIIELMIATAVFSVVLLVLTSGIMQIGRT
jgi:prepilin-type N-terminal cleavage/methylation domain-containing protein